MRCLQFKSSLASSCPSVQQSQKVAIDCTEAVQIPQWIFKRHPPTNPDNGLRRGEDQSSASYTYLLLSQSRSDDECTPTDT